jgi:hypothetical protein
MLNSGVNICGQVALVVLSSLRRRHIAAADHVQQLSIQHPLLLVDGDAADLEFLTSQQP